ncbi:ArsR/SmtB family transcription factor [Thermococcus zilligii]|uniref:ArsR/SmtB family transcription factor n=1 Tax=Thermococcus zilligii TaxID=54076 RepID=UPI00029B3C8D|nr:metalloregulator ArsR/SmtB family transcription factor [Thermococcus zilligii]
MKVRELIERLPEKQKESVGKCAEKCGLVSLDEDIPTEVPKDVVEFSRVISNPLRLSILRMLRDRWLCVCLIAKALEQDQTLVSHHLRALKGLDLLEERREGKLRFYRTKKDVVERYFEALRKELLG